MPIKTTVFVFCATAILLVGCQQDLPTEMPSTSIPPAAPATNTALPSPTKTAMPTDTPLPTATPGPVVVKDDFTSQTNIWGDCDHCEWKDGALFFGPYPAVATGGDGDQIFYVICETCGSHPFYRVSADVTYFDGYGDRTFGVLAGLSADRKLVGAGTVTTLMHALYESFDYGTNQWVQGTFKKFNAVHPGRGTNHIEVAIQPGSSAGSADIIVSVNDKVLVSLVNQSENPSWAGLYLGWHTVGAFYDNFEYEEIPSK